MSTWLDLFGLETESVSRPPSSVVLFINKKEWTTYLPYSSSGQGKLLLNGEKIILFLFIFLGVTNQYQIYLVQSFPLNCRLHGLFWTLVRTVYSKTTFNQSAGPAWLSYSSWQGQAGSPAIERAGEIFQAQILQNLPGLQSHHSCNHSGTCS